MGNLPLTLSDEERIGEAQIFLLELLRAKVEVYPGGHDAPVPGLCL